MVGVKTFRQEALCSQSSEERREIHWECPGRRRDTVRCGKQLYEASVGEISAVLLQRSTTKSWPLTHSQFANVRSVFPSCTERKTLYYGFRGPWQESSFTDKAIWLRGYSNPNRPWDHPADPDGTRLLAQDLQHHPHRFEARKCRLWSSRTIEVRPAIPERSVHTSSWTIWP